MSKNVIIIGGGPDYRKLFTALGFAITNNVEEAQLAVFTGGADVTPSLYGDEQHWTTGNDPRRDKYEMELAKQFKEAGVPMVGICRGGQFLNVFSGGRMYQNVERHCQSHSITDVLSGETIYVSSTHHQMIMPSPEALVVATAALGGAREWFDGAVAKKDVSKEDIEVVFYEKTKALCFQPHPEFDRPEYEGMKNYFAGLLVKYLGV
jgi:gamma-glutamyl-gamma-aminobutyrate hydrolase PuuD